MRVSWRIFALASAVCLSACQGADRPSADLIVSDSAGVPLRTSSGAGIDRLLGLTVADEPHLRIGTLAGGEATQFTNLLDARRLSDGSLLVAESGDVRVRLFDVEGSFLRWIGSVGEGPGEYARVGGIGVLEGDTIWVQDQGREAFVLFRPDGTFVRSFRPDRPAEAPRLVDAAMLPDGTVVDQGSTLDFSGLPGGTQEIGEDIVISVVDREGLDAVSVAEARGPTYQVGHQEAGGRTMITLAPDIENRFGGRTMFAFGPDRIFRADPAAFEIREISPTGDLLGITRIRRPRIPFTDEMISEYETAVLEGLRQEGLSFTPSFESYVYADSLPHFGGATTDDTGRLWLSEFVEHRNMAAQRARRWWRVGGEGGIDGYVEFPEGFRLLRIQGDEVWGSVRDELDVPYLVAYRLVEP